MPELIDPTMFELGFMRRALIAALLVGVAAPLVGIFLVQRRLSLIGDGLGHVALAGVAIGLLTHDEPVLTALIVAALCGIAIELMRAKGRTSGDVALAIMFYGGIAAGVVIINKVSDGSTATLNSYLFGAITTTSREDLWVFGSLTALIVLTTQALRTRIFAVANDEEYARAAGLPVLPINILVAILTATTVVVSMRVVGLLLISALMIVPNAASQRISGSFRMAMAWAVLFGVTSSVGGVMVSYQQDTATGGTIVLLTIGFFLVCAIGSGLATPVIRRVRARSSTKEHDGIRSEEAGHPPGVSAHKAAQPGAPQPARGDDGE